MGEEDFKSELIKDSKLPTQFPEIGDKNLACVILGVISVVAMFTLEAAGIPIVTGCAGAIGGFVVGDKLKGK